MTLSLLLLAATAIYIFFPSMDKAYLAGLLKEIHMLDHQLQPHASTWALCTCKHAFLIFSS